MKKIIGLLIGTTVAVGVIAVPVTVTYSTSLVNAPSLFHDSSYTTPVAAGSYAELILLTSSTYDHNQFSSYTVLTTCGYGTGPFNLSSFIVGKSALGDDWGNGRIGIKWLNTQYDTSYYIAIRFYNNPDKNYATAYGVMTPYKLTKSGSTDGLPDSESKHYPSANKWWTEYPHTPIPEPASLALVGLGGLALVLRRKMQKEA